MASRSYPVLEDSGVCGMSAYELCLDQPPTLVVMNRIFLQWFLCQTAIVLGALFADCLFLSVQMLKFSLDSTHLVTYHDWRINSGRRPLWVLCLVLRVLLHNCAEHVEMSWAFDRATTEVIEGR